MKKLLFLFLMGTMLVFCDIVQAQDSYLEAEGISYVNKDDSLNAAQRAAVLDAYRILAEIVGGVKVEGETTVNELGMTKDEVHTAVQYAVSGAKLVSISRQKDGTIKAVACISPEIVLAAGRLDWSSMTDSAKKDYEGVGYYYLENEGETLSRGKEKARLLAERNVIEQAKVAVWSASYVQNFQLTEDEVETLAGGLMQVNDVKYSVTSEYDGKLLVKAVVHANVDVSKTGIVSGQTAGQVK